jgi:hypothetical protein
VLPSGVDAVVFAVVFVVAVFVAVEVATARLPYGFRHHWSTRHSAS